MSLSYHEPDPREKDIPSHGYSSEFVTKAMARLVNPIDPNDPDKTLADLTIKCGSLDVEAHSHVLCQESPYFKVICKGDFVEGWTQELNLPAEEEFLIRRLLCYCYTTGYNDEPYDDETDPPPRIKAPAYVNRLYLNSEMYSIADKYDIPSLKDKAAGKFYATTYEVHPQRRGWGMSLRSRPSTVDEIMEVIPHIYSSTPDGDRRLRDRAVEIVLYYLREVRNHPGLRDLMLAVPEFFEEPCMPNRLLTSKWTRTRP